MAAQAVVPALLIRVIAEMYRVSEVVICTQGFEEDAFGAEVLALSEGAEFIVRTSPGCRIDSCDTSIIDEEALHRTLFVECQCDDCFHSSNLLMPKFVWLSSSDGRIALRDVPLRLDSNFLTYTLHDNGSWNLHENFKVKLMNLPRVEVAAWTEEHGVKIRREDLWERRSDLEGVMLTNVMLPFTTWNIIKGESPFPLDGLMPNILDTLATSLNFSMQWMLPNDGSWGGEKESGEWTGIIGTLMNGSADFSSAGLVVSQKRKKVIDFSLTVAEDRFYLYHLSSQKFASQLNVLAFLNIFNVLVWVATAVTTFLIAVMAILTDMQTGKEELDTFSPYLLGVWFPSKGSTSTADVRSHTRRVLLLCAGLMTFFLSTSFSVDLIAHMTAGSTLNIRGCSDLKKSNAKLFALGGTVMADLLTDGFLSNCQSISVLLDSTCDHDCTLGALKNEASSSIAVYYATELFDSHLANIPGFPSPAAPIAYALTKDSELTGLFDHHLLKLIQNGVLNRLYYHWVASYRERYSAGSFSSSSEVTALSFDQLFFPMLVMGSGMSAALAVSCFERLYSIP